MLLFPIRPLLPAVAKNSPFKELIVVGLQRIIESGTIDHYDHIWSATKPKCIKSVTKIKSVDIEQASVIFIFLAAAMCLGFLILLAEIIHFKCGKQKKFVGFGKEVIGGVN